MGVYCSGALVSLKLLCLCTCALAGNTRRAEHICAHLDCERPRCAGYAMEAKSSIIAIGLTVHNTPVEIREKLSVPEVRCAGLVKCVCCI